MGIKEQKISTLGLVPSSASFRGLVVAMSIADCASREDILEFYA